jgi:hypothetical protein
MALSLAAPSPGFAAGQLSASRSEVTFGRAARGYPSPAQPVFLTNVGDLPVTLLEVVLQGTQAGDYAVGGTCTAGMRLAPGERCRLDIVITPLTAVDRPTAATLAVTGDASPTTLAIALDGIVDPLTGPILVPTPAWLDFAAQPVGVTSAALTLQIGNASPLTFDLEQFALVGGDAGDFTLSSDCHAPQQVGRNQACTATVAFTPRAEGPRSTELQVQMTYVGIDGVFRYSVTGAGAPGGVAAPVNVVEYYNATLDHYFITWLPTEQANLDAGRTPTRWMRTGYAFRAYTTARAGTSPVCRYYIPPPYGDSHFFGRGQVECDATGAAHPQFTLEDPAFMHVVLPVAGTCPADTTPVYRVFSGRADANHRYMTDRGVRDQMVARGWIAEGDGPDLVVMCGV